MTGEEPMTPMVSSSRPGPEPDLSFSPCLPFVTGRR
jgi:hypothetical protein